MQKRRVVVLGTRGIPDIMGGVETHCEELFPIIASKNYDVTIVRRSCYLKPNTPKGSYKGVSLKDIYAPRKKSFEAIVHTFLGVIYAKRTKADILHIHAIGPSILTPFAKLLGLKVVITHHGADYDRQKWNGVAKTILKLGEKFGANYANKVIVISQKIKGDIKNLYNREDTDLIYNGVPAPKISTSTSYINELGLTPQKYIIALGRFVEEKGFDNLIDAYSQLKDCNYKLVIAGDADHKTPYSERLKELANSRGVTLTGFIKGDKLHQIMTNAALFVLPSYHEGLPISLLEAMSYNLDVIVSNIPANTIRELNEKDYFEVGDINALTKILERKLINNTVSKRQYDMDAYNWNHIASQTIELYKSI